MQDTPANPVIEGDVEDRIRAAIVSSLKLKLDPRSIPVDLPLVEKGLGLDSVSILQLVGSIEDEFMITIDDTDIARDLFRDVRSLGEYVRGKMNGGA